MSSSGGRTAVSGERHDRHTPAKPAAATAATAVLGRRDATRHWAPGGVFAASAGYDSGDAIDSPSTTATSSKATPDVVTPAVFPETAAAAAAEDAVRCPDEDEEQIEAAGIGIAKFSMAAPAAMLETVVAPAAEKKKRGMLETVAEKPGSRPGKYTSSAQKCSPEAGKITGSRPETVSPLPPCSTTPRLVKNAGDPRLFPTETVEDIDVPPGAILIHGPGQGRDGENTAGEDTLAVRRGVSYEYGEDPPELSTDRQAIGEGHIGEVGAGVDEAVQDDGVGVVVPVAYTIEDIVQAQKVVAEEDIRQSPYNDSFQRDGNLSGADEKLWPFGRRRRGVIILTTVAGITAAVLIALGATGQLGNADGASINGTTTAVLLPRFCDDLSRGCWVQAAPALKGPDPGDAFGDLVSMATSGRRFAVSAPLSAADALDGGLVRVYDSLRSSEEGVIGRVKFVQVGQDVHGIAAGDKAIGVLSGDGRRLVVGMPLNDGITSDLGDTGAVQVYGLDQDTGLWVPVSDPMFGDGPNENVGKAVALSHNGSVLAVGAPSAKGLGRVRVYQWSGTDADGKWIKIGQDIIGEGGDDQAGRSLALSKNGEIVAVGASNHNANGFRSGHVRVFRFVSDNWVRLGQDIGGIAAGDGFGNSVSLSANGTVIAGAAAQDESKGYVSIFGLNESANEWIQLGRTIYGSGDDDELGEVSLSEDGTRVAASSIVAANRTGYVKAFGFNGSSWDQIGGTLTGQRAGERFGSSIAFSGHSLLVGSSARNSDPAVKGHARFFELPWLQVGEDLVGLPNRTEYGFRVSLAKEGDRVAVSAFKDSTVGKDAGAVFVYDIGSSQTPHRQIGQPIYGLPGDRVTGLLSGDGSTLIVGARFNDGINGTQGGIGQIRVFRLVDDDAWTLVGDAIYGDEPRDKLGRSMDLNADGTVIVTAASLALGKGRVRVYANTNGTWTQKGQDLVGENPGDNFGWYCASSASGNIVAVGARYNSDSAEEAGHIRVFRYSTVSGTWTQLGQDLDGESEGDRFGSTVDLSADGMVLAGGAFFANDNDSGHIRVFSFNEKENEWAQLGQTINGDGADHKLCRISLSSDGRRLATGLEEANSITGYVRVYDLVAENESEEWVAVGSPLLGQKTGDDFGYHMSVSGDGTRLAVGAPAKNSKEGDPLEGRVRLYDLPPPPLRS